MSKSSVGSLPASGTHRHAGHRSRLRVARHPDHEHAGLRQFVLRRGRRLATLERAPSTAAAKSACATCCSPASSTACSACCSASASRSSSLAYAATRPAERVPALPAPTRGAARHRPRCTATLFWTGRRAARVRGPRAAAGLRCAPRQRRPIVAAHRRCLLYPAVSGALRLLVMTPEVTAILVAGAGHGGVQQRRVRPGKLPRRRAAAHPATSSTCTTTSGRCGARSGSTCRWPPRC